MKQVVQSYRTGELTLAQLPVPALQCHALHVRAVSSLISVGTERTMLSLAQKSLAGKALARPDLVKKVIDKARTEGPLEAYRQAMGRLDTPVPLGYSAAGTVLDASAAASGFSSGDRVACAGSGVASHAEVLRVPRTLAVKIPEGVNFEAAAFVALGGIALHAMRQARLEVGERVVVLGLGLLGQLAVQLLTAAGCPVCGLDLDPARVEMALAHGARAGGVVGRDALPTLVDRFSDGRGADAVLIFAATEGNGPIETAAELARERGRIVAPGLVGLDIPRQLFYEKELDFVVSRAWGPGMYDPDYEAGRADYPFPYVRWTAQRNMAAFLDLLAEGRVTVEHLITHRYPIEEAVSAYEMILEGKEPTLGVILQYHQQPDMARTVHLRPGRDNGAAPRPVTGGKNLAPRDTVRIGLIGAGLFAKGTLLPALKGVPGAVLHAVATTNGLGGEHVARKFGMAYCTTDTDGLLHDPEIDLVFILTRHGAHAGLVCRALEAGKHVFVEKPLALDEAALEAVISAYRASPGRLMVGFNRRFAHTTTFALERLGHLPRPLMVTARANVGHIPRDVWVHDPQQGGGNLVGEACHFVDLIQALTGSYPVSVYARAVTPEDEAVVAEDNLVLALTMANGSLGTIVYTALGDKAYPREQVEVFGGGGVCVIDNFKTAVWSQAGRKKRCGHLLSGVDRGHRAEMAALIGAMHNGEPFPVPFESYVVTTRATFAACESLRSGGPVAIKEGF